MVVQQQSRSIVLLYSQHQGLISLRVFQLENCHLSAGLLVKKKFSNGTFFSLSRKFSKSWMVQFSGIFTMKLGISFLLLSITITVTSNVFILDYLILKRLSSYCMSHLKIQRKRLSSPGFKLHSEQSREQYIKRSVGKILTDNIGKRRMITHNNSPQNSPPQLKIELEEAKRVYQSKNTKKALPMFRKLHQQIPTSAQIPYYMGSCLLNEGQFESAVHYFRISLQLNPNRDKNVHIYMAICYKALENYPAALKVLDEATLKNPKFEQAFFYKGKIHLKIKNYAEAIVDFKKCIALNPHNQLAHIQYADSLRASGKNKEAIQRYQKVIAFNGKHAQRACLKKITLLIQTDDLEKALTESKRVELLGFNGPEIKYYQGCIEFEKGNFTQASVLLQLSLTDSQKISIASKSLRLLMQIAISQKDFFGAEHLVNRTMKMEIKEEQNILLCTIIEGINDLIKRKLCECSSKLISVVEKSKKLKNEKLKMFLNSQIYPYLAYCLFLEQKYKQSFAIFQNVGKSSNDQNDLINAFNREICQGIIMHEQKEYTLADQKFMKANQILPNKFEPIFLNCINLIKILKYQPEEKEIIFLKIENLFRKADNISPPQSLFFFYKSLVYLYQGRNACEVIDLAIQRSDEEVSEYFFIQGLSYSLTGKTLLGLKSINKAIELDCNIPEFFKQRSKYFYVLERYEQAVEDVLRIILDNDDEQAKLLLTFYYYMTGHYKRSLEILDQINTAATGDRFKDFESAILFRMGRYTESNLPGHIVSAITTQKDISPEVLQQVNEIIRDRCCFSEFSTYHFHLLLAAYYCYNGLFDQSLDHLFGCLEEIQNNFSQQSQYITFNNSLLSEIKFNIVIVNLCKDSQKSRRQGYKNVNLEESMKYMELFMTESEEQDFVECMRKLMEALKKSGDQHFEGDEFIEQVYLHEETQKISQAFPEIQINLTNGRIKTRIVIMYPQKLKFNIYPEFDDSFLFNFDMDKVDTKLCPPWYNLCKGEILFTDQIRNQSVMISETEKSNTPLLLGDAGQNLRDKFKLNDSIERKLNRLMKKGQV